MSDEAPILYEIAEEAIALITLNRPEARNAQNTALLYALNDAFDRAAQDEDVKVIILAANGPHFSAGHDLREAASMEEFFAAMADYRTVGTWAGYGDGGASPLLTREKEIFVGLCERWRNLPKPTIAAVQGACIAGGLMLAWPCDIIIAADNAMFQDNTVAMGVGGVEYFGHPWELGVRKAKELLFTADWLDAEAARQLGMVNKVVPLDALKGEALAMARRIAAKPIFALKLAKEAVNAAQDAQGRDAAMKVAFGYHQVAHAHNQLKFGYVVDPSGVSLKPAS
ncbi:MAG TPA: enoyl-CoA hydratase [Sphingopyxis sp.]|nr:enoyl-CoA hydratase [Sphingopyxis sp.]HMP43841.1 enoyl-CoA hydratase [Sphingopyxis sp.]HMQ18326.1 enoyl-CoA hydratase [Sphingopyxis sp.]